MEAMLDQIGRLCQEHGIQKTAWIIDDDYSDQDLPPVEAWEAFIEGLTESPNAYLQVSDHVVQTYGDVRQPISEEELRGTLARAGIPEDDHIVWPLVEAYVSARRPLQVLKDVLIQAKFTIHGAIRPIPLDEGRSLPSLFVVDYHIDPEDVEGATACRVFSDAMERCRVDNTAPPFVILMSQKLLSSDRDVVARLAERAGLFRFNYDFIQKEEFRNCPAIVGLTMLKLFQHARLSKAYFRQLLNLENITHTVARETIKRLFQITPAEISAYRPRVDHEGTGIAATLSALFSEHVSAATFSSESVLSCMKEFDAALTEEGLPAWDSGEGGNLHRLYAELLFTRSEEEFSPPKFGDVYQQPNGDWLLIISQECDLAAGGGRQAKARSVLGVAGRPNRDAPEPNDGRFAARPFLKDGKPSWIWWDLLEPHSVPYGDLYCVVEEPFLRARPDYRKRFRLRNQDAEDIQQQFASRLTRVGADVLPTAMRVVEGVIEFQPTGSAAKFEIGLLKEKKESMVALLHPNQVLIAMTNSGHSIPPDLLLQLATFTKVKEFQAIVKKAGFRCGGRDGILILGAGPAKHWEGLKEWKEPI